MPNFNIHWRGYPHRHLPRIRVASPTRASVRSGHTTRFAPRDSISHSLRDKLERERKKQKFAFRRRRGRKSRSTSSVGKARKHASLRARQHIQVFGWDTAVASKANTPHNESAPSSIKAREGSRSPPTPAISGDNITQTTVIDSHDGAASSAFRCRKTTQPEKLYSLMHVAEVPVYWTTNKAANRRKPSTASSRALTRPSRGVGQYAHVGPLDPVSRRRTYHIPPQVGRSRTYDSRIDPRSLLDRDRLTKSFPPNPPAAIRRTASRRSLGKSWQGNPELRRILKSKVSKAKDSPRSVTPSVKSIVQTLLSDTASRTPSQRKALKQFTKELELYLQAAKSVPKQSLVPSPSATTISAHTVEELRPYQSQLRSAGLAVTSADQRRESSIMAKMKISGSPPPTPPKDGRYLAKKSTAVKSKLDNSDGGHHHHKTGSIASFDTATTVMDFTLPHEQTGPRAAKDRRSSSSDHTVMAFTPPHEKPPPQPKSAPPPPPRISTKKSLPWLPNKESSKASPSPSPKNKSIATASMVEAKARNPSDVLLSNSGAINSTAAKSVDPPKHCRAGEVEHRNGEVRFQNPRYKDDPQSPRLSDARRSYIDAAIQAVPERLQYDALTDQGTQPTDAINQTDRFGDESSNSRAQNLVESRPLSLHNESKTFPTSPQKCASDCNQTALNVSGEQSTRKRYRDQAVQTDVPEDSPDVQQSSLYESNTSSLRFTAEIADAHRNFPSASTSPFQRSPTQRSSDKSIDDLAVPRSSAGSGSPDTNKPVSKGPFSSSTQPGPLRCTQCSAELDRSSLESSQRQLTMIEFDPQPASEAVYEPGPEPEIEPQSPLRGKLSHTCTARSSLECQQCAPQYFPSPISAHQQSSFIPARSLKQVPCQFPAPKVSQPRTTDWAATLESDLEEIIQGYHSPEERFMQRKIIQDTIDKYAKQPPVTDPVKKPSFPRLKLRPPPTSVPLAKHLRAQSAAPSPAAPVFADSPLPQSQTTTTSSSLTRDESGISDRTVFRGLHVATAAACDEDVAKWIEEITGIEIRKFLADLSAFDGLGFNTLAGVARRAAKQRRGELRAWEKVRERRLEERELDAGCDGWAEEDVGQQGPCKDRKMVFVAGDKTVSLRDEKSVKERSEGEELDGSMKPARECRIRENLTERAVRMGWRERSLLGEV